MKTLTVIATIIITAVLILVLDNFNLGDLASSFVEHPELTTIIIMAIFFGVFLVALLVESIVTKKKKENPTASTSPPPPPSVHSLGSPRAKPNPEQKRDIDVQKLCKVEGIWH